MGSVLVSVLDLAVERDWVVKNVARRPVSKWKKGETRQTCLTRANEVESLLSAAQAIDRDLPAGQAHRHAFISVLVFGGLRISEALELRWRDVHFANSGLTVSRVKTKRSAGDITLLPPLREALLCIKPLDVRPEALIFPTSRGTKQGVNNARRRWFVPVVEEANALREGSGDPLLPALTPHGLRHTCVSMLVAAKWNIFDVARHVGHEDVGFTDRTYNHAVDRRDGEGEKFAALIDGGVPHEELQHDRGGQPPHQDRCRQLARGAARPHRSRAAEA